MDPYGAATPITDPDALEFIRFCYRRRRVGWPELYDEMCAVAARGLFRGYGSDDLAAKGIAFGLFEMPALAAMCRTVVAEEQASRRSIANVLTAAPIPEAALEPERSSEAVDTDRSTPLRVARFAPMGAGA